MIELSKPFLPPKKVVNILLKSIWKSHQLTNNGPLLKKLEETFQVYFNIKNLSIVNSGTMGLQVAIKSLNLTKKIITTPFSYVATSTSILWEGCEPVFADIDSETLNVNPEKVKELIDNETQAILVTHCFGNACDVDELIKIAKNYNLKLLFDGAHCFGTEYKNKTIFKYGDISVLSLHSTKLFHMVEGGVIFTRSPLLQKKINFMRNFGHNGPEKFEGIGINGKNSEFHSAIGIANFQFIKEILNKRKLQSAYYDQLLFKKQIDLNKQRLNKKMTAYNFAYYPIIFSKIKTILKVQKNLAEKNIVSRRYFYPSLNNLSYSKYKSKTPISDSISGKVLCIPLHHYLKRNDQRKIVKIILEYI